ncbi:hypothetical protein ACQJBY_061676 [Aegilops geniculata]
MKICCPKLPDFGLSRCFDENQSWTITTKLIGPMAYLAPEVYSGKVTEKSDMYSLGVITMEILTGEKGYTDVEKVLESWKGRLEKSQGDIHTQLRQVRVCAEVGKECTDYNPKMRPDPRSIITRLDVVEPTDVPAETSEASSSVWHHRILTADDLKQMLRDENAQPRDLPLSLLEEITNCFSDDQEIGRGGFAVVYKGMLGNVTVAVKKLFGDINERSFIGDVKCLMKAKHKNVIRFLGYCADSEGRMVDCEGNFVMADVRQWLLCFEYLPRGSLSHYITDPSSGFVWRTRYKIIEGICQGLNYLHQNRILHLDLNPKNILMDDNMVPKIADFGQQQTHARRLAGRMGYVPPEYFNGKLTTKIDIYSLGVIIMEIVTGKKGYCDVDNILKNWRNRMDVSLELEQVRVCAEIGMECIDTNPARRPAIHHIIDRLVEVEIDE